MCLRLITDNNELKTFKSYSELAEFAMNEKNIAISKKLKGTILMTKKEYGKYLNR
jgi:hypothetical protein